MASSVQEREELELLRLRKKKAQAAQQAPAEFQTPPAEQQAYAEQGRQTAAQGGLTLGPDPRSPMAGAGETAAALGSGALLTPLSGLAGLAGMALPGPSGQGGDWARGVQGMGYQPRTLEGQVGTEIATAGPVALNKLANLLGEKVAEGPNLGPLGRPFGGSPLLGAAVNTGINTIPMWGPALGNKMWPGQKPPSAPPRATPDQNIPLGSIRNPQNAVKMDTFKEANAAGYKFPPTHIEDSYTRARIEGIGGKAAIKQQAAISNQLVTNELARKAARLPPRTPIDEAVLNAQRYKDAEPYREIVAMSPRAGDWLKKLGDSRFQAKEMHRAADKGDPQAARAARRLDDLTEYYERKIDAEAVKFARETLGTTEGTGLERLIIDLREARRRIAISHDVERALNVGTGDVDARVIGRMVDKRGVKAMSGELLTIGKTAQAFPQFMGAGTATPTPGVSALEATVATAMGMGGVALGGIPGILAAGLPFARHPIRSLALSNRMQKPLSGGQGLSLRQLGQIPPGILTPSLGLRPPQEE